MDIGPNAVSPPSSAVNHAPPGRLRLRRLCSCDVEPMAMGSAGASEYYLVCRSGAVYFERARASPAIAGGARRRGRVPSDRMPARTS